jgi:hypothetical protein
VEARSVTGSGDAGKRRTLLLVSGLGTLALDAAVLLIERRLDSLGGPSILDLEFAGSSAKVAQIASEWGSEGLHYARLQLWIDFAFMVCYGTFFLLAGLATRDFARSRDLPRLAAAGAFIPYFAVAAALFDACENVIWLLALSGDAGSLAPIGTACAAMKFSLIAMAIVYAVCGLLFWLWSLRRAGIR